LSALAGWKNLELLTCTHRLWEYHADIQAQVTEWVCFNTVDPRELDAVRPCYPGVDKIATLPKGSFLAYNRDSRAELAGRVF
jgi:hypothetical protein